MLSACDIMTNTVCRYLKKVPAAILALILLASLCGSTLPGTVDTCYADDITTTAADNLQQAEIEILESAYKSAEEQVAKAKERVAENQRKIDTIMRKLPAQQKRTDAAIRGLYEMQKNRLMYIDAILSSETLDDFLKQLEYYERASKSNLEELNKLKDMKSELDEARKQLDAAQEEADAQAKRAHDALLAAQNERAAKQQASQAASMAQDGNSAILDGADWHMTEDEFIAAWAPRIDAYLEGSPTAGTGTIYAKMAFKYCVDPRWSPAISNTESGKGRVCIRPYNAWGWGAADSDPYNLASEWSSWEEGIEAHVRGLANGYGYTISKSAAEKYCSTPDSWYANTLSEMARI